MHSNHGLLGYEPNTLTAALSSLNTLLNNNFTSYMTLSCGLKDPGSIPFRGSLFLYYACVPRVGTESTVPRGSTFRDSYINNT